MREVISYLKQTYRVGIKKTNIDDIWHNLDIEFIITKTKVTNVI